MYSVGKESWESCRLYDNPMVVKGGRDRADIVDGTHSSGWWSRCKVPGPHKGQRREKFLKKGQQTLITIGYKDVFVESG